MKIGIHHSKGSYSQGWIDYCVKKKIDFKIVNAYHTDIIKHLEDCDVFMWHHHQANPKDVMFAKQLLYSLECAGKIVYPDWSTGWHFDDKLGQKYLLEASKIPLIPTFAFFSKEEALSWAENYKFPAVFKLRGGAGSYNVKLAKTKGEAVALIKRAFGRGFRQYSPNVAVRESIRKYRKGENSLRNVINAFSHYFIPFKIEESKGREKGYAYFQEFIPDCEFDIRVQIVGDKSYAMKRFVRHNDFRASGGGDIDYDGSRIPVEAIRMALDVARKLKMQSLAIDLVPYKTTYLIAEVSYAFGIDEGELDFGYWDSDYVWHPGVIDPFGWMIEDIIARYENK